MSAFVRQPGGIPWGAGALTNTEVDGSNRIALASAKPANLILWNQLGNAGQVTDSRDGLDFSINGAPTYPAAKFGNGILLNAAGESIEFTTLDDTYDLGTGMLEFWFTPDGYNIVNSASSDGQIHVIGTFNADPGATNVPRFRWYFYNLGMVWAVWDGIGNDQWVINSAAFDLTAGTMGHMLFVWDRTHATEKRQFWFNGVKLASRNVAWNDADMTGAKFFLGDWLAPPPDYPVDGVFDNIKWYSSTANLAEVVANRNTEGFPYPAAGDYESPVIDAGAGRRLFLCGWSRSAYVDDEVLENVRVRSSDTPPDGAATGQGTDDDGNAHDYWSAPVWSPTEWETLTQGVQPVTWRRYIQFQANLRAATDLEDTPKLEALFALMRARELTADTVAGYKGQRIKQRHLKIGGIDLAGGTSTLKFPAFSMRRGRGAAGLSLSRATFSLENASGAFNVGNRGAWMGGQQVYGTPIEAWLDLTCVESLRFDLWKGVGEYIQEDERRKVATLHGIQVNKTFTGYTVTGTGANLTPAAALRAELDTAGWVEGVDYDRLSFEQSVVRQEDAAIKINYNYSAAGAGIKLSEFIRHMAIIGCADVFFFAGRLYYRAWTPYVAGTAADLTWFEEAPVVTRAMQNFYNDYMIDHGGGTETDAGNNNLGAASRARYGARTFKLAASSQLAVTGAPAAVGLGDLYIQRDLPRDYNDVLVPLANVTCAVDLTYLRTITLDSFVRLTWPRAGFDLSVFEVSGMTIDSDREVLKLTLREAVRA